MPRLPTLLSLIAAAPLLTGCGPSPEDACAHVIALMQADLDTKGTKLADDKVVEIEADCVEGARKTKEIKGALEYKKEASCVMDAQTLDAVAACTK